MTNPIKPDSKEVLLYIVSESPAAANSNHVKVAFRTAAELDQYWARVPNDAKRNVEQRNFPVVGKLDGSHAFVVVEWDAPATQPQIGKRVLRVFGNALDALAFVGAFDPAGSNRTAVMEEVTFTLAPGDVGMHSASSSDASRKDVRTWDWSAVRQPAV